jgi:hypothetical protein
MELKRYLSGIENTARNAQSDTFEFE